MKQLITLEEKIRTEQNIKGLVQGWNLLSQTVVFTNGCFDILHSGHIHYLAQARDLGDKLIIGLNSDASVKRQNKGSNRPINKAEDRAKLLCALHFVDAVVIFDEATPLNLVKIIEPDILVKGGDYDPEQSDEKQKDFIVGSKVVRANGGSIISIPLLKGYSTTALIEKLKN